MPPAEEDIQTLIEGCKKNDRKAQELIYKKFYVTMGSLCARYVKNEQDAMQVLNDGFLKMFINIKTYDEGKASFYTWLRKIIINTAIGFLRKSRIVFTSDLSDMKEETSIENHIIQKMNADELLSLIRQLPAATQLVFNLYTVDGFNHREIGEMLGISEGTSKWHVSEARKKLKQSIMMLQSK